MLAFSRTRYVVHAVAAVLLASSLIACRLSPSGSVVNPSDHVVEEPDPVPSHITRLAIWYPSTEDRDTAYSYMKLEQAAFQLKKRRSGIRVVERRDLEAA